MKVFGRSFLAILAGIIVTSVIMMLVEAFSSRLYPMPAGLDQTDMAAMRRHVGSLPTGAFLLVLLGWVVGTFAGALLAGRLAPRASLLHGIVIGLFFLLGGIANMLMIPHPAWMWVLGMVAFLSCGYAGGWLATRFRRTTIRSDHAGEVSPG